MNETSIEKRASPERHSQSSSLRVPNDKTENVLRRFAYNATGLIRFFLGDGAGEARYNIK
jgi:hypothetical protein